MTQSKGDGVGATASTNLVIEVDEMSLDGRHGDAAVARDFLVGGTGGYLPQNLHLSRRQSVGCRAVSPDALAFVLDDVAVAGNTAEKAIDPCYGLVVDAAGN